MEISFDAVGGLALAASAIVYVVRLEGKLGTLKAILDRVEQGQKNLEQRYNFDGRYTVTEHRRPFADPAE